MADAFTKACASGSGNAQMQAIAVALASASASASGKAGAASSSAAASGKLFHNNLKKIVQNHSLFDASLNTILESIKRWVVIR